MMNPLKINWADMEDDDDTDYNSDSDSETTIVDETNPTVGETENKDEFEFAIRFLANINRGKPETKRQPKQIEATSEEIVGVASDAHQPDDDDDDDGFVEVKRKQHNKSKKGVIFSSKSYDPDASRKAREFQRHKNTAAFERQLAKQSVNRPVDGLLNGTYVQYNQLNPEPKKAGKCHFLFLDESDGHVHHFLQYGIKRVLKKFCKIPADVEVTNQNAKKYKCHRVCYDEVEAPTCIDPFMWFHHMPEEANPETGKYDHYGMLMLIINNRIDPQKYIEAVNQITLLLAKVRENERPKEKSSNEEPIPADEA